MAPKEQRELDSDWDAFVLSKWNFFKAKQEYVGRAISWSSQTFCIMSRVENCMPCGFAKEMIARSYLQFPFLV